MRMPVVKCVVREWDTKEEIMNKRILYIVIACAMLLPSILIAQDAVSEGSKLVEKLKFDEIEWDIPKLGVDVTVDTLDNGMVLFMMEDHRLPVFNVNAIIRTGARYEPIEKMGLAGLTGTVMRTGGTDTLDPDSLNAEIEYLAASVETRIGDESGSARLNCMSKDIDRGLALLADIMMNPAFRQDKIDLEKDQIKENIRRRNDSPGSICSREFFHLLYDDHPYGSILEWETVAGITREDMIAFHDKYYVPNNVWLGITGDFKIEEMREKISKAFAGWDKKDVEFPAITNLERNFNPGVYLINRDVTQSNIRFGHLGVDQYNPDRFAISIMNYILGGGSFTSRMTTEVRSNMGLAYSVGSSFSTGSIELGSFYAYCQTKTETTHKAIAEMVRQIKQIKEDKVTDTELNGAKDSYINRFVFGFTDPSSIVARLMNLEYENMPRDFYETYLDKVRAVNRDDVQRVAKKYLDPDHMTFLVVGDTENFDAPLDEFGEINMIDLKEPVVE